jgi:hypothetical protein
MHVCTLDPNVIFPAALSKGGWVVPHRAVDFGDKKMSPIWLAGIKFYTLNRYLLNRKKQREKEK